MHFLIPVDAYIYIQASTAIKKCMQKNVNYLHAHEQMRAHTHTHTHTLSLLYSHTKHSNTKTYKQKSFI